MASPVIWMKVVVFRRSSALPHTVLEHLWKLGRNGICLSRPWKSVKTEWSLWKFVNFAIFRVLGKTYQLICQKLHFPRQNSSLNKTVCCAKIRKNAPPISFDIGYSKGCTPLPDVWKSLRTFILLHHFAKFCEMFVNFERIFLYEPCIFFWGFVWQYVLCMQYF